MKFIKLIKSSDYEQFLKNTYKDFHRVEELNNQEFMVQITPEGYLHIRMIMPYSMQERWPWAVSQKPLTIEDYEMLDHTGDFETSFNIYQVPKYYELNHPKDRLVDTIIDGTQLDVFKKLLQLSKGLEYLPDRT